MSDGFLLSAWPGLSGLWPLFILALVTALAAVVEKRLSAAWARADVKPGAARIGFAVAASAGH